MPNNNEDMNFIRAMFFNNLIGDGDSPEDAANLVNELMPDDDENE